MASRVERKQNRKKRKWIKPTLIILGLMVLAVGVYGAYLYKQVDDTVTTMYEPLDDDQEKEEEVKKRLEAEETINVLLLGVDERNNDSGRSDTMIFASLNPQTNEMMMLSIPRDTRVEIPGRGMDKINHAYAFGGSDLSVKTVENFLDTTVHFYARVNMEGLKDGVDALGGVTVNNDFAFTQDNHQFDQGELHLNGERALAYARMRKKDPEGDLGRNDRQQEVINSMVKQAMSFESFTKIDDLLNAVGDNVKTNMQMNEMRQTFTKYRGTRDETVHEDISGRGEMIDDIWYYIVSEEERSRVRKAVQQHIDAN
ncbi:LCP family protein [Alkalibacillus almallahensis]|uniref:LCP family glycopolymer transferase n=1 Tax=Alkalibacillus almallahensis TaxID=1379154 RepID=UPI0014203432|nr:LCP family protein [Alkalibacillus almallahensis]NIK11824.1 LCP family protein required for cell wall assembly [Alkalibacillus almallahensis]